MQQFYILGGDAYLLRWFPTGPVGPGSLAPPLSWARHNSLGASVVYVGSSEDYAKVLTRFGV